MVFTSRVMAGSAANFGVPGPLVLVIGLLFGTLAGGLNGVLVTRLRLPPFIVTLGTLNIFTALTRFISGGASIQGKDMPDILLLTGQAIPIGPFRLTTGVQHMLAMYVVGTYVLRNTAFGRHIYAVGDDREAARVAPMIVVAGEALIDRIESPDGRVVDVPGGGPYNVARTIARLGGRVAFLGRLSTDGWGVLLRSRLVADGVETGLIVSTDDPTTIAHARVDGDGVATYEFNLEGTASAGLVPGDLPGGLPPDTAALHVGTLGLVVEPMATTIETLTVSAGRGVLVMLDLNCRPSAIADRAAYLARIDRILARVDIVKASVEDLAYLRPGVPARRAARGLLDTGPKAVLLTDGGRPVRIVSADGVDQLPIPPADVVDTVGAGDAFGGGFLSAWIGAGLRRQEAGQREALITATVIAIAVARLTTTRAGAEPPAAADVRQLTER